MKIKSSLLKRFMSLFLALTVLVISIQTPQVEAGNQGNKANKASKEKVEETYVGEGYEIIFKVTSQWDNGFNADITVTNTSDTVIDNWTLGFELPHEITNIWNGVISSENDDFYIIKNAGNNQDINVNQSINFGFSCKGNFTNYPIEFKILSHICKVNEEDYSVEYILDSDWGNAYTGIINISNNTDEVLEDWILEFDFEREITNISNGTIVEHIGSNYVVKNATHNQNIAPGSTVSIGFNGKGGNIDAIPSNYTLNEIVINNKEYIQLQDGEIEKDYLYNVVYTNLLLKGLSIDNVLLSDDYDGDGLTLAQEYEYDTNPFSPDTDEDGLNDYDEVFIYKTNPNNWDTDGDSMSDGTEVASGLNPLMKDSDCNGIIDNQEIIDQEVRLNSFEKLDISETGTAPSVNMVGKGDYSYKLNAVKIEHDETILDIDCLVGTPFDFVHEEELDFESSVLTFKLDDSILENNSIEDLAIAYYDDEQNILQLLDTTHDIENNSISAEVEHYSIYMVVDLAKYFFNIDWENKDSTITSGKADVVFVIDTTGSMGGPIRNVQKNINQFVTKLEENQVDIRLGLVEYRDIYADGTGSTKSYDWYTSVEDFKTEVASLGISGGGDAPESAVDALHCAQKMKFRTGVKKYIILVTDANYKDGIVGDSTVTMQDEISKLVESNIVTSVITRNNYYPDYKQLVEDTEGIAGNIFGDFAIELEPLIIKMSEDANQGYWIRLSNGSIVCLDSDPSLGDETVDTDDDGIPDVIELKECHKDRIYNPFENRYELIDSWTFYSNPVKKDTDGDGIFDIDDLRPSTFDTVVLADTDLVIVFNTGRTWNRMLWNSFDYLENICYAGTNIPPDNVLSVADIKYISNNNVKNLGQSFNRDELTYIGLFDNEGSKFYLNEESEELKEFIFRRIFDRESNYIKHSSAIFDEGWKPVPKGTESGFIEGAVLSEADINFSLEPYYTFDLYTVLDTLVVTGAIIVITYVITKATPVILTNIQGIIYYVKTFGVYEGLKMYMYLGTDNLPNGVITWLQMDLADGDTEVDDLIGSSIPIHERGITGEQALAQTYPGESQKYFSTLVDGVKGGRYVDQFSKRVAYEAKVGYACLSERIRIQILKDAWLLENRHVEKVVWVFYKSDITGRIGASKPLLDFLDSNGIEYIIHN